MGAFQSFDRLKANKKDSDKELAEQVKALREFWKKPLKKAAEDFGDEENGIASGDAETVLTLISLTRNFSARYRAKKQEKNLLDFSDLEHEALALFWEKDESGMKRPSEIAREYRSHFAEIYVDEYQDSNGVQEELLRAIEAGRLFLVGDIKQSIYGFRHAKPELFAEKYRSYHKDSGGELPPDLDTRVDLRKNFRSREDVLASCNAVFRRLMREELGGVAYDDDAALYPGAAFPAGEDGEYATELLLCEREAESEEADAVLEAELVARRIRELMDPETGIKVSDGAGGLRPAAYGDIAVLLRATSGQAERFVEVLMSHGIPALAEQKTGYFDATEVRTVLSLLRAIDNPFRDISLAAVLSASVGGLSEEELAALETEKLEILRRAGYPVDYLRPAYRCETCRDTGFVDGKKCRCFRQKIIARLCRQGRPPGGHRGGGLGSLFPRLLQRGARGAETRHERESLYGAAGAAAVQALSRELRPREGKSPLYRKTRAREDLSLALHCGGTFKAGAHRPLPQCGGTFFPARRNAMAAARGAGRGENQSQGGERVPRVYLRL